MRRADTYEREEPRRIDLTTKSLNMLVSFREFLQRTQHLQDTLAYSIWDRIRKDRWSVSWSDSSLRLEYREDVSQHEVMKGSILPYKTWNFEDRSPPLRFILISGDESQLKEMYDNLMFLSKERL